MKRAATAIFSIPKLRFAGIVLLVTLSILHLYQLASSPYSFDRPNDLRPPWLASRALLQGQNPYPDSTLQKQWQQIIAMNPTAQSATMPGFPYGNMLYPPAILIMMAPFTFLPWISMQAVWYVLCALFYVAIIWAVWKLLTTQGIAVSFWELLLLALAFKGFTPYSFTR